jgi:hypothetical protein
MTTKADCLNVAALLTMAVQERHAGGSGKPADYVPSAGLPADMQADNLEVAEDFRTFYHFLAAVADDETNWPSPKSQAMATPGAIGTGIMNAIAPALAGTPLAGLSSLPDLVQGILTMIKQQAPPAPPPPAPPAGPVPGLSSAPPAAATGK